MIMRIMLYEAPSLLVASPALLDPNFNPSDGSYIYTLSAANSDFTATATPARASAGSFTITSSGSITGTVVFPGWTGAISPTSFW